MTRAPKVFTPELLTALSDRFKALTEPARLQLSPPCGGANGALAIWST